jgi:hypothetical protein
MCITSLTIATSNKKIHSLYYCYSFCEKFSALQMLKMLKIIKMFIKKH